MPEIKIYYYKKYHIATYYGKYIQIGCECYSIAYWLANYKKIGLENNYSPEAIAAYGRFIKRCAKLEQETTK